MLESWNLHCRCPKDSSVLRQNFLALGEGVPLERGSQKEVPPEVVILLLLDRLVWKAPQIGTGILPTVTSTGDEFLRGINISDLERPWTTKIEGFSVFLQFSAAALILRANCAEMAEDRPKQPEHEIFSLKVNLSNPRPDHLSLRRLAHASVK